jgi:hypothetical protein
VDCVLGCGIATATFLQKKGQSWISPATPSPRQRIPALVWNAALVGFIIVRGGVNWQHPSDFNGYVVVYGVFVSLYLAATSAIGFARGAIAAGGEQRQQSEKQ